MAILKGHTLEQGDTIIAYYRVRNVGRLLIAGFLSIIVGILLYNLGLSYAMEMAVTDPQLAPLDQVLGLLANPFTHFDSFVLMVVGLAFVVIPILIILKSFSKLVFKKVRTRIDEEGIFDILWSGEEYVHLRWDQIKEVIPLRYQGERYLRVVVKNPDTVEHGWVRFLDRLFRRRKIRHSYYNILNESVLETPLEHVMDLLEDHGAKIKRRTFMDPRNL